MPLALLPASPGTLQAQAVPVERAGGLTEADLRATFDQLDALGRFFGAFVGRESNGFARERWRRLSVNYQETAARLHGLLDSGALFLDDLPPGRSSALLDDGRIAIDVTLDGRWMHDPLQLRPLSGAEARRRDLLEPVLMAALARRYLSQDWQWMADHLRAVGALGDLGQQPLARPLLARFFQAKDAYLWLALQRIAEGDPAARQALARRQVATFETIRDLRTDMAATFGAEAAARLQRDWADYVALVDGFATTRGWVLLDPALKRTQIGAAARREADAVEQAAAGFVAEAPRSAVAAAAAGLELATKPEPQSSVAQVKQPGVNLETIVSDVGRPTTAVLAARLPLEALALRPETLAAPADTAAARAFAARVRQALSGPDPRQVLAEKEVALGAAQAELTDLQARVGELDRGLAQRSAEAADLEAALTDERARLAAAEQRAEAQAAAAASLTAEVEALTALRARVGELDEALAERARLTAELESALLEERERLVAAEQRAEEQSAAAESLSAEVAELSALKTRLEELDAVLAARNDEAEALATALAAERVRLAESEQRRAEALAAAEAAAAEREQVAAVAVAPVERNEESLQGTLAQIAERQLYMMVAIAVIFILAILLWLRSRDRPTVMVEPPPPLLLTAGSEVPQPKAPAGDGLAARPIIEVEEAEPEPEPEPEAAPETHSEPLPEPPAKPQKDDAEQKPPLLKNQGLGARAYGVAPETPEARAAMKAGAARSEAATAAKLGSESDAAADPIVKALRKGNLPLFELLFSELTGLRSPQLQRIVYGGRGEDLAIVCRALEIEKLLFGSIYLLTDTFRGGDGDGESERTAEILRLYDRMSPATAKKVLAKWQRNWGEAPVRPPEEGNLV